ncbi:MAG: cytochrome c maturation protein CcmE [Chloroflexota bacterium]
MSNIRTDWEKPASPDRQKQIEQLGRGKDRLKFMIGGVVILAAVAYLIISSTLTGARYFITVDELVADPAFLGETVRISGAVDGDTIVYDEENLIIEFEIAHIPNEFDDLATALHQSVSNPAMERIQVRVENEVKPDLLQHEAQAILTGALDENGVFHADELLLKCPSRFEEDMPDAHIPINDV